MPESTATPSSTTPSTTPSATGQPSRRALLAASAGLALALLAGFGGTVLVQAAPLAGSVLAALAGWLAQPAFALAWRWWRPGMSQVPAPVAARREGWRDMLPLALAWAGAIAVAALALAWPLAALRASASLGAALATSVVLGLLMIALWRSWPFWQTLERDGGRIAPRWRALRELDTGVARGLAAAGLIALAIAGVLLLAWPGLLSMPWRWVVAALSLVAWPLLHVGLQAIAPARPLPLAELAAELPVDDDTPEVALDNLVDQAELDAALYSAARRGRVQRALELLDAGADPQAAPASDDRDQRRLAVLAAVLPDLRLLRELISRGLQVNTDHAGMTPLLAATRDSWHGRPEAVMTLLANGADPRAVDGEGNTPLHHAARSSDPGVAALLRDAAADLDARNNEGMTPLGIACAAGNWRLARFLLERGASAQPVDAQPPLVAAAAAEEDDPAGVLLLLKHKARVDACDAEQRSALHAAAGAGHAEIVSVLLAAGADVHARDGQQRTPWLAMARGAGADGVQVLERLLPAQPALDAVDQDGRNALALACQAEAPSQALVQRLLESGQAAGLDPKQPGHDGRSATDFAAAAGRWQLVTLLDPDYPLPAAVSGEDASAGQEDATAQESPPRELLDQGLREGRFDALDDLARLLPAAELGGLLVDPEATPSATRIDWLLARGADPQVRDGNGDTALLALLDRGSQAVPAVQALLRHGVAPGGRGGLARFLEACVGEERDVGERQDDELEACALALLERGADPFAASTAGDPALALAVRLGWERLLQRLVAAGVWLDARDSHGMTALHLATALGREATIRQLIAQGALPDQRAADGQTPLGAALSAGRRDLADWLDWRGWTLPGRALRPSDLPAAAIVGDAAAVRRLLALGMPVDAVDSQGCSALLRAAGGGHGEVVDLLLERGADPGHAADTGATPLSAAVSMRQGEIVERLLAAGAELEQRLPGEVTVLMLAAALGLPDLAARLLAAGADVDACDAQGLTPLHCAALYGFGARERPRLAALFDTLLLAGADANATSGNGVTPLLLLLGARAEPGTACDVEVLLAGLDHLLDEDVALDARDPRGFGPLHLVALHGLLPLVQRLLRAGADPDQRDALNRSPRELAVMRGFVDVAAELASPVAPGVPGGTGFARNS